MKVERKFKWKNNFHNNFNFNYKVWKYFISLLKILWGFRVFWQRSELNSRLNTAVLPDFDLKNKKKQKKKHCIKLILAKIIMEHLQKKYNFFWFWVKYIRIWDVFVKILNFLGTSRASIITSSHLLIMKKQDWKNNGMVLGMKVFGQHTMTYILRCQNVPHMTWEMVILEPKNDKYLFL